MYQRIDLAPNVWLHSSVGRASHLYCGSSIEALLFSGLLLSTCLNWKIYCNDHSSLSDNSLLFLQNTGLRQCGKSFTRSDELQRHLRIHTKEKSFLCSICNKAFGRSDHLSKHLKTHDNERKKASQHNSIEENCVNSSTKLLQVDDNDGNGVNVKNWAFSFSNLGVSFLKSSFWVSKLSWFCLYPNNFWKETIQRHAKH